MLKTKQQIKILAGLATIAIIVLFLIFSNENNFLKINFLDVGQGDAIFIETPLGQQILIDGGPDLSVLEKLGNKMPFYDRHIDAIILTHPEADHISGLIEVIKRYEVGAIIFNGAYRQTEQYQKFLNLINNKNIPIYIAKSGGSIEFSDNIKMDILYPFESLKARTVSNQNNSSVVSRLVYNNIRALFTGDIEEAGERELLKSGAYLQSDILKVAHHGSKTSSTKEFLNAVDASVAVIMSGKDNQYGHPHKNILENLKDVFILNTGDFGSVEILTDGEKFEIK